MNQRWIGWVFIGIIILGAIWIGPKIQTKIPEIKSAVTETIQKSEDVYINRVVDGDTVEMEGGIKIRYIGVNTPETKDPRRGVECFGEEAFQFNKNLIEGKKVTLEKDISDKDKYGRLLRYVWLEGVLVNEELVKQGFASVATYPPDVKYYQRLLNAQNYAKDNQLGLWIKCKK